MNSGQPQPGADQSPSLRGLAIGLGAAGLLLGGCASVVHKAPSPGRGTATQAVEVVSEPTGAQVLLAGQVVGITPVRVVLKRNGDRHVLRVVKEGYVPVDVPLKRSISGAVAGNLPFALFAWNPLSGPKGLADNPWSHSQQVAYTFVFPAVGVGIDFLTGAAYKLPARVEVVLEPLHTGPRRPRRGR